MFPTGVGVIRKHLIAFGKPLAVPHVCGGDPLPAESSGDFAFLFPTYVGVILILTGGDSFYSPRRRGCFRLLLFSYSLFPTIVGVTPGAI